MLSGPSFGRGTGHQAVTSDLHLGSLRQSQTGWNAPPSLRPRFLVAKGLSGARGLGGVASLDLHVCPSKLRASSAEQN